MFQKNEIKRFDFSDPGLWVSDYLRLNWAKKRYKLLYGSRGRGGTTNVVQTIAMRMLSENMKGMMVRKVFEDIRGSQWDSFKQWAEDHDVDRHFVFQKAPLEIICKPTGSVLISRGMNNPGRAKSVPGLSLAWYEEADELSAEDFRQTSLSIRGENIEEWLTFNSPPEDHWLLERFFPGSLNERGKYTPDLGFETLDGMFTDVPSTDNDAMIIHACYKHNPFNKQSFIDVQERDRAMSFESYRVSGLGLIGRNRTGKEFFWAFDTTKNVRPGIYDPTKYLHIGFDFNRSPYMTLVVFQITKVGLKYEMQGLKEYCLEHPLNNTESVCKAFKHDIDEGDFKGHKAGVRFYGDYSGKTGRTTERDGIAHDYDVVWSVLARYLDARSDWVVPNPLHKKVSMWMNAVFAGKTDVLIYLDPKMSNTIKDFIQVKEDADGSMLKEKAIDRTTGKSYEKLGHTSQATYYCCCSAFADSFDAYTG